MSFASACNTFFDIDYNEIDNIVIAGTAKYVKKQKEIYENRKSGSKLTTNRVSIDINNLKLFLDVITISNILYGITCPDVIDSETLHKACFFCIYQQIVQTYPSALDTWISILEEYFNLKYSDNLEQQISVIVSKEIQQKVNIVSKKGLFYIVESYLPIYTQEGLLTILDNIISFSSKKSDSLLDELQKGDFSSFSGKTTTDATGRTMVSKGYWAAYKWIISNKLENVIPELIETIVAKAIQSPKPFFDIRTTIVVRLKDLKLEEYTDGSYQDLSSYLTSIQSATDFKELWYYAVRMKGLIYELIYFNTFVSIYEDYSGFEYRSESDKKSLSQIIGNEQFAQLVKSLSAHIQLFDPVPDFFYFFINDAGTLEVTVIEVGWVTDIENKKIADFEKWEPFLGYHKGMNLKIQIKQLYSSSREQETWPLEFTSNNTVNKWVKTMKSIFSLLKLTPEDELEIENSILSSTMVRKLLRKNAKLFCPLQSQDLDWKVNQVLKYIESDFSQNDFKTGLSWSKEFSHSFCENLYESLNSINESVVDLDELLKILNSNELFSKINFEEPLENSYVTAFLDEESKLESVQEDLFSDSGYHELSIIKILNKVTLPSMDEPIVRTRSCIDKIVTLSLPGMTTVEKNVRKIWSSLYLYVLLVFGIECYSDRLYRICYTSVAYQNVGGKINLKQQEKNPITQEELKNIVRRDFKIKDDVNVISVANNLAWLYKMNGYSKQIAEHLIKLVIAVSKISSKSIELTSLHIFGLRNLELEKSRSQEILDAIKRGMTYYNDFNEEFDNLYLDKSLILCARDKDQIDTIHECLGHESEKEKVIKMITAKMQGAGSSRNNPSLSHSPNDILTFVNKQFDLNFNLNNIGKYILSQPLEYDFETSLHLSPMYARIDEHLRNKSLEITSDWNIFQEVFKIDSEGSYKYLSRLSYKKTFELMWFQSFKVICILSILAKLHLQMKSKFNGLKDISLRHLGFVLYIYEPKNSKDDKTPCVLHVEGHTPFRFNMDYAKSKLWLSLPYQAALIYNELLQEYNVFDHNMNLNTISKLNIHTVLKNKDTYESSSKSLIDFVKNGPLMLNIGGHNKQEIINYLKDLTGKGQIKPYHSSNYKVKDIVNYLLCIGTINFICQPAIYNNKLNNEFRQALRFIYGSDNAFLINPDLGKKFSHITRYSNLFLDKIIGFMSSHPGNFFATQKELKKVRQFDLLNGPCYIGFLPIINERVMTTCMFICHLFNKVISNYDESLLKTIDGLFEIPLQTYADMKTYTTSEMDLVLAQTNSSLRDRVISCLQTVDNSSKVVIECLNYGCQKLKEKLIVRGFNGFETASGLHNNFMDISEVTNCISKPRLKFDLYNSCDILLRTKFNKMIKYGTNTRSKRQDSSFIETLLFELEPFIKEMEPKDQKQLKQIMEMHVKKQVNINEVTLRAWMEEDNPQVIISHCKNIFSESCYVVKQRLPEFFKDLEKLDLLGEVYSLFNEVEKSVMPPELSDRFKTQLLKADMDCEILYSKFEQVKTEIRKASKFLSLESIRNELYEAEMVFINKYEKIIDYWFRYLLVFASLSPTCLAGSVKNLSIKEFLLTDKKVINYEYAFYSEYPYILSFSSAPFLSRYIAGCLISKVRLFETHFTSQTVHISELGATLRRFIHNTKSGTMCNELNRFFSIISHGNWKTGSKLLESWKRAGLPRSTRAKVIFEAIKTSALHNTHNVASVALLKIKSDDWFYFAGVAPKAQLGGLRDLLVQEFNTKLVLHVLEQLSLHVLSFLDNDILGHPNAKDIALKRVTEIKTDPQLKNNCFFVCGDKKKWAQKHSTLFFFKFFLQMFGKTGWSIYILMVLVEGLRKTIEIPSVFIEHYIKKIQKLETYRHLKQDEVEILTDQLMSDIPNYHKQLLLRLLNDKAYISLFTHMGQGIYHKTSSLYGHAAELFAIDLAKARLNKEGFNIDVQYWRSSDDYMHIITVHPKDALQTFTLQNIASLYFKTYVAGMFMCNIRESEKTIVTTRFGEIYSTYASEEIIPASIKFYVPNMMLGSSFTPLDIWRTRFAKMQQMFDNGTSLSTINLYSLFDVEQIKRFFQKNYFDNKIKMPNLRVDIIPKLSDVVFGTLSNSEFKVILDVIRTGRVTVSNIRMLTEFLHEVETPKSKIFFEMASTKDSLLKEIYRLPFSKKYEAMKKKMSELINENLDHVITQLSAKRLEDQSNNLNALNLLARSSKLDSSLGEDYRFVSALNSKNIIWGLTGGTREDSIQMLRQVVIGDYRDKITSIFYEDYVTDEELKELRDFGSSLKKRIQYPTEVFDSNLIEFLVKHKDLRSISKPMKKINHYYQSASQVFNNTVEQILTYIKEPDMFMELKPRLNNPELMEYDVEKLTFILGISRDELKNLPYDELLLNLHENRVTSGGVRQTILTLLYDSDWRDLPRSALLYNTVRPWIFESTKAITPILSNVSLILDYVTQILSCVANFSGNEYVKRKTARELLFSPNAELPSTINLETTIFSHLVRLKTTLPPNNKDRYKIDSIFELLIDNIGETSVNVKSLYEDQFFESNVQFGGIMINYTTCVIENTSISIATLKDSNVVISSSPDSTIIPILHAICKVKTLNKKQSIRDSIDYLIKTNSVEKTEELLKLYRRSNSNLRIQIVKGRLTDLNFKRDHPMSNFCMLLSFRSIPRTFRHVDLSRRIVTSLSINNASWKKLETIEREKTEIEKVEDFRHYITGSHMQVATETRLIKQLPCTQWLDFETAYIIKKNSKSLLEQIFKKTDIQLLPKLRISQLVTKDILEGVTGEMEFADEQFLYKSGTYILDAETMLVETIEIASSIHNILMKPETTIFRVEVAEKLPAFMSPYLLTDWKLDEIQKLFTTILTNLQWSEGTLTLCLFYEILRFSPEGQLNEDLYQVLNDKLYTWFFDLYLKIHKVEVTTDGSFFDILINQQREKAADVFFQLKRLPFVFKQPQLYRKQGPYKITLRTISETGTIYEYIQSLDLFEVDFHWKDFFSDTLSFYEWFCDIMFTFTFPGEKDQTKIDQLKRFIGVNLNKIVKFREPAYVDDDDEDAYYGV